MTQSNYANYKERLATFNQWPAESPVYIKELVEAGFVYTGQDDLVYCFRCGITAKDWKDNDAPLSRHETLNKSCIFLSERLRKVSTTNLKSETVSGVTRFKSLEDYEKESIIYDWDPKFGVVRRNSIASSSSSVVNGPYLTGSAKVDLFNNGSVSLDNSTADISPRSDQMLSRLQLSSLTNESMRFEESRFQSFAICPPNKHWPSPETLAKAGFHCINYKGQMRCFACGIEVEDWESSSQDPMKRHRSMSPRCTFMQVINGDSSVRDERAQSLPAISDLSISTNEGANNWRHTPPPPFQNCPVTRVHSDPSYKKNMGIMHIPPVNGFSNEPPHVPYYMQSYVPPKIDYSDLKKRLQTFITWPKYAPIQPVELAKAGFYYTGKGDGVRCYSCAVCLKDWDKDDEAWAEHYKHSPNCPVLAERMHLINMAMRGNPQFQNHPQQHPYCTSYSRHNPYVKQEDTVSDLKSPFSNGHALRPPPTTSSANGDETVYRWMDAQRHVRPERPMSPFLPSGSQRFQQPGSFHPPPQPPSRYVTPSNVRITQTVPIQSTPDLPGNYQDSNLHGHLDKKTSYGTQESKIGPTDSLLINQSYKNFEIDKMLDLGFPYHIIQKTIECYSKYSAKPFSSPDALAQAVIYYQEHGNLEGSPFGENLAVKPTKDGKDMIYEEPGVKKISEDAIDRKLCSICMDNDREITFVPCGHFLVCQSCALDMKLCPMCRKDIENTVRTYLC